MASAAPKSVLAKDHSAGNSMGAKMRMVTIVVNGMISKQWPLKCPGTSLPCSSAACLPLLFTAFSFHPERAPHETYCCLSFSLYPFTPSINYLDCP